MRIEINPPYEYLRGFLEQVPARFETMGTVIHCGRNLIKTVAEQGVHLNIKRYAVPSWVNRVAYTFFRLPKGKRAFDYPQRLLGLGFETPEPVAYIEERREGLIAYSYFVSIQSPYPYTFCCFGNADVDVFTYNMDGEADDAPDVSGSDRFANKPLHLDEALMQLENIGGDFFVFINAETTRVNVVYRKSAGGFALIDPVL